MQSNVLTHFLSVIAMTALGSLTVPSWAAPGKVEIKLIHTGDFHGHMVPRANARSDGSGLMEGGLARVYQKVKELRGNDNNTLYLHTGDTIQGGAEALYTRGQAIVDVIDNFGIDGYAPGNWEFVYGTNRFVELFGNGRWGTVAANVRYATAGTTCVNSNYVVPPYLIKNKAGLKIGLLGFTTDRGPQVVGSSVTAGLCFLSSAPGTAKDALGNIIPDVSEVEAELRKQIAVLRNVEKVDLLIVLSELGLANNVILAQRNDGIDAVFSSDMHEETKTAIVVNTPAGGKTILVEEGQDGTMLGELKLEYNTKKNRITEWKWTAYTVNSRIKENPMIAAKVAEVRKPFVTGTFAANTHVNPFNGSVLSTPIDTVIGQTSVALHRSNFAHENMAGVIEGTSHDFLTDAFRTVAGADIGAIRGFRYGTHVNPGAIRLEDLYHFMPIGAQIARGTIKGQALKNQIEGAADGSLNPDPRLWTGGWLFNFSAVTMTINPYAAVNNRASAIKVNGADVVLANNYSYASYWYPADPCLINRVNLADAATGCPSLRVAVRGADGKASFVTRDLVTPANAMDGTEVVWQYLRDNLGGSLSTLDINRTTLTSPLPAPVYINSEVQPLRGAQ